MAHPLLFSLKHSANSGKTAGRVTVSKNEETTRGVEPSIGKGSSTLGNAPEKFHSTKEISEGSSLKSS